nr:hypothetical protein [Tanacetum cinerariifolium]
MSTPTFAETHNLVAFLEKPSESEGFEPIIDFLNAKPIGYALTMNHTIYASCVKQFWTTAKVKKVNGQKHIQALVDKQKVIIMEESIRRDLKINDAEVFLDKQAEGMAKHKEIYVISSHAKKVFANMRRQGQGFSRNITPLFETMIVNAQEEVGEGSGLHIDSHHTPTDTQPSSSKPQKKINPKRKQRQAIKVHSPSSEISVKESVPTPSNDPLPSGEDSIQLNKLMIFCTNLQQHVLDLEEVKTTQANKIANLKKRVKKLEKRRKLRPTGLGIEDIDQDAEIALVDEAQRRMHDVDMFGVDDLEGNEVIVDVREKIVKKEFSTADPVTTTGEVVTVASVEVVTVAKGIVFHEQVQAHIPSVSSSNDKGKAKMIKPEKPLKKKDQITLDEEVARKLEAKIKAEIEEEERIAGEKDKENRAMIEEWDDIQATIHAENVEESLKKTQPEVQAEVVDDDTTELKRCLEIVPEDDDDVAIEATRLSSKSPTIVDYKIYREGKKSHFKIIRADGNSQNYLTFGTMFKNINREDLEVLRSSIKERFKKTKPVDDMKNLLFQTLKTMF